MGGTASDHPIGIGHGGMLSHIMAIRAAESNGTCQVAEDCCNLLANEVREHMAQKDTKGMVVIDAISGFSLQLSMVYFS